MAKGDMWELVSPKTAYRDKIDGKIVDYLTQGLIITEIGGKVTSKTSAGVTTSTNWISFKFITSDTVYWIPHTIKHSKPGSINSIVNFKKYVKQTQKPSNPETPKPSEPAAPSVNTTVDNTPPPTTAEIKDVGMSRDDLLAELRGDVSDYSNQNFDSTEFSKINSVLGVHGLPFQFLPSADPRIGGQTLDEQDDNVKDNIDQTTMGYEYTDKIISKMPLLFMAPGKPAFMKASSKEDKKSVLGKLLTGVSGDALDSLTDGEGRYYQFQNDSPRYYQFVNPMCRIAATYMGLGDVVVGGTALKYTNWEDYTKTHISISDWKSIANWQSIPFYIDTETSINESMGNSTTESMLASGVNNVSDMGRELNFLFGSGVSLSGASVLEQDADARQNAENVGDTIAKILGSGNVLSNLAHHLATVATGGKLVFPEIWSDSSFSRSYSCEFKFISPDASKLSIYLNVIVPLLHLIAFVSPQTDAHNPNGFFSPFLVRATYKGFFNVDMGIITDMSVNKGQECQWTPDGLPTSITVNLSIKDLYDVLAVTPSSTIFGGGKGETRYDTLNNTALMDYIANLCGINIYRPEAGRMIDMWMYTNITNRFKDTWQVGLFEGLSSKVQQSVMNLWH